MFKCKKKINIYFTVVIGLVLTACYPDTLRQQLAGIDTIEVVFYDKAAHPQDTLSIGSKGLIKTMLNHCSKEKYTESPYGTPQEYRKYGKILFKKQRQQLLIMEGTLYFDGTAAYIAYTLNQQKLYRKLEREQIEFFEFARHHKEFYQAMY